MSDLQPQEPAYPIQPTFIVVREVHFISHRPPSKTDRIDQSTIRITQKSTSFNEEKRRLQITLTAEFNCDAEPSAEGPPFSARVAITGEFSIGASFPSDKIQLWAAQNARFVLYPYLRERMHYISNQGGYPPIMLPLIQIPTIRLENTAARSAEKPG
jgi:preprotein translocase subunit SecB